MRENGGKTERKWFSQFHQGDWSGPFKEVDYSSPSRCDGTARYDRVSAPQRVDQRVLERACRDMALNASWRTSSSPDVLSGSSLFDEQRTRASNVVEQAKAQRRLQHERHIDDLIRTARPWSSPTCDMLSELRPASSSCSSENHLSLKCAAVLLLVLDMCRKKMKERIKTKVAITAKMI
mmetsp:Transcript_39186/g.123546  ORF Transcript_39186/g.123546 Transcript_39186/m.123546 type:complete len:179 (-) Transcript_39186:178-714(-)